MPSMRDYLVVRTIWALMMITSLLPLSPLSHVLTPDEVYSCYFYAYWLGAFLLTILVIRVAMASLGRLLWSFPGLLALRRIGYRWFMGVGFLLITVVLYSLLSGLRSAQWSHLGGAFGLVELLAVASVLMVGIRAGLSPRSRMFGILAGLGMEPAAEVLIASFARHHMWTWSSLILQIVTDSTLILWIVYLLLPDHGGPLNEPSEAVLRWDQVARWATRERPGAKEDASSRTHQRHRLNAA